MADNQQQLTKLLIEVQRQSTILSHMEADVKEIKDDMKDRYVTNERFEPVQKIVYGLVGLILIAVVTALLAIVVNAP